jgi:hypothetical protein
MNPLTQELIKQATTTYLSGLGERDELDPEKLVKLVARRCIQVALDLDDPIMAVEMADLFGIDK